MTKLYDDRWGARYVQRAVKGGPGGQPERAPINISILYPPNMQPSGVVDVQTMYDSTNIAYCRTVYNRVKCPTFK